MNIVVCFYKLFVCTTLLCAYVIAGCLHNSEELICDASPMHVVIWDGEHMLSGVDRGVVWVLEHPPLCLRLQA